MTWAPISTPSTPTSRPYRFPDGATPTELTADELSKADAVVLLVNHTAFDSTLILTSARYVLDTKAHLPQGSNVERL